MKAESRTVRVQDLAKDPILVFYSALEPCQHSTWHQLCRKVTGCDGEPAGKSYDMGLVKARPPTVPLPYGDMKRLARPKEQQPRVRDWHAHITIEGSRWALRIHPCDHMYAGKPRPLTDNESGPG